MEASPGFFEYAPIAIATTAMVISLLSLVVSYATFKTSGPVVRASYSVDHRAGPGDSGRQISVVRATIVNRGRSPVYIDSIRLAPKRRLRRGRGVEDHLTSLTSVRPTSSAKEPPIRLEAAQTSVHNYEVRTRFDGKNSGIEQELSDILALYSLYVALGNGKTVRCRGPRESYLERTARWIRTLGRVIFENYPKP